MADKKYSLETKLGEWTLVERKTFSAPATSYTFSGLNGDVDKRYKLNYYIVNGYAGTIQFYIQPNADSTAGNYAYGGFMSEGATLANVGWNTSAFIWAGLVDNGEKGWGEYIQECISGKKRCAKSNFIRPASDTSEYFISGFWTNTADNITSLMAVTNQTNGIGTGSYIELWKLAQ